MEIRVPNMVHRCRVRQHVASMAKHYMRRITSMMTAAGALRQQLPYAVDFLEDPPKPRTDSTTSKKNTKKMMLAVSPWREPKPRSQYQCSPTLGGSPAKAGAAAKLAGTARPPAVAATARKLPWLSPAGGWTKLCEERAKRRTAPIVRGKSTEALRCCMAATVERYQR
eukprot:TRINITY_DN3021_c0_g2_i6.p1 TRINITY_DN3021_c0_g2~~TRINITY_DN3021_c0_g2_i6.p1  ORF type:complete len:168 (-),score=32.75 TRINITY_DN3021_c0_g2_i6:55-558(-)